MKKMAHRSASTQMNEDAFGGEKVREEKGKKRGQNGGLSRGGKEFP